MTIPFAAVLFSVLLIYLNKIPVALAMQKEKGGYNNSLPRDQQANLKGFGKRALGAHYNSFEAFPIFAIGVIISSLNSANETIFNSICIAFILIRIAYSICYLLDITFVRSSLWTIGFLLSVSLYLLPFYKI
ncbi:MAPEG family protein [Leptospira idonii]|uniref:MAPEG family protein n=1 Tax=Leptospira idonii TaxID=1193500 RepID=A0A4R9LXV8_9LEPT|nr:MAPEG family protein [Leptospira idonii]TGN18411.1 MAPEG family protein [Leptospira idonii]